MLGTLPLLFPPETTLTTGYPAESMLCVSFPSTWTKLHRENPKTEGKELTPLPLTTQIFILVVLLFSLFFQSFSFSFPLALIYLTQVYKEPHISWDKEGINSGTNSTTQRSKSSQEWISIIYFIPSN